ncbi:hypothetical protein WT08_18785 [Burkholderia sp. MSMB1552]|nr:hypothetical protein WT08_18785 [Burkholderia sp. MSMB1552]
MRQERPPAIERRLIESLCQARRQRRFDIPGGLREQWREGAVLLDQDAVLIQPAFEFVHQIDAIGTAPEPLLEPAHDIAALMFRHWRKAKRLISDHLMVEECALARFVERAQRAEVRRLNPKVLAQMAPQDLRNVLVSIECRARHAHEPDMQCERQPV